MMRELSFAAVVMVWVISSLFTMHHVDPSVAIAQPKDNMVQSEVMGKYIGASSCGVLGVCHGSTSPRKDYTVDQNEHYIWLKKDRHSAAYDVLLRPRSVTIAKNLDFSEKAEKSPKCLACHALDIPAARQAERFQIEDGVSCEACHGPAEKWIIEHTRTGETGKEGYKEALALGMYDIRDPRKRAERCVSCHLGNEDKGVDHEMIAAGHPILTFELDTFEAQMPRHRRPPKGREGDWLSTRTWAIGQAVALRESVQRLARRAQQENAPGWPEFAEFNCFACHHEVKNVESTYYTRDARAFLKPGEEWPASWRQRRGYDGVAGIPRWDASQYVVFRELVEIVAPSSRQTLDEKMTHLSQLMGKVSASDPKKISAAAADVAAFVDELIPLVTKVKPDAELLSQLLQNIAEASPEIAGAGFRVAGQAAMAVDALFVDYRKHVKQDNATTIDEAIDKLFESLEKPETYAPEPFQERLQAVQGLMAK